jgi:hypothetical protein
MPRLDEFHQLSARHLAELYTRVHDSHGGGEESGLEEFKDWELLQADIDDEAP